MLVIKDSLVKRVKEGKGEFLSGFDGDEPVWGSRESALKLTVDEANDLCFDLGDESLLAIIDNERDVRIGAYVPASDEVWISHRKSQSMLKLKLNCKSYPIVGRVVDDNLEYASYVLTGKIIDMAKGIDDYGLAEKTEHPEVGQMATPERINLLPGELAISLNSNPHMFKLKDEYKVVDAPSESSDVLKIVREVKTRPSELSPD